MSSEQMQQQREEKAKEAKKKDGEEEKKKKDGEEEKLRKKDEGRKKPTCSGVVHFSFGSSVCLRLSCSATLLRYSLLYSSSLEILLMAS